jgi:hypothetical protein
VLIWTRATWPMGQAAPTFWASKTHARRCPRRAARPGGSRSSASCGTFWRGSGLRHPVPGATGGPHHGFGHGFGLSASSDPAAPANFPWYGVEQRGIEPAESVEFTRIHVDSRSNDPTRVDVSARELVDVGPSEIHSARGALTIEDALAFALVRASAAQEWAVVAQLARELEARRLIAAGVRSLVDERGRPPPQK